jgi:hypothetical protein
VAPRCPRPFAAPALVGAAATLLACGRTPPPSQFPDAEAAIGRMRATYACSRGVSAEAKLDYIGPRGRARGNVLYMAAVPDRLRLDLSSPFGAMISTLTSDGKNFTLMDLRERRFFYGPANACNLARFTQVSLPPAVLVDLLRGEAPVIVHDKTQSSVRWDGDRYVVQLSGKNGATEHLELEPTASDFGRPWSQQRVRVLGVSVEQYGVPIYRVSLDDHAPTLTAKARVDPDGIDPPIPASGPACSAELPRRIRIEVPPEGHDLVLTVEEVSHNAPLPSGVFTQAQANGLSAKYSPCE